MVCDGGGGWGVSDVGDVLFDEVFWEGGVGGEFGDGWWLVVGDDPLGDGI